MHRRQLALYEQEQAWGSSTVGLRRSALDAHRRSATQVCVPGRACMVRGIPAWSSEAASSPRPEPFTNVAIAQAVLFLNLSETARAHVYGRRVHALP